MMNQNSWIVVKFGGTSVQSLERWQKIAQILKDHVDKKYRVLVICSAISGISNALQKIVEKAAREEEYQEDFEAILARHLDLAYSMELENPKNILEEEFKLLQKLLMGTFLLQERSSKVKAQVMALGEIMLSKLGAAFLQKIKYPAHWLDIREHLVSDKDPSLVNTQCYESAMCTVRYDESFRKSLESLPSSIFVTQGFIARNEARETVLLGRGGSDTSASYLGVKIGAKLVEIWTDVPGMFTANPQDIPSALLLPELDYEEAEELASSGAKVLHPRCIEPLKESRIPLDIRWTEHPEIKGTRISADAKNSAETLKAIICKKGVYLISIDSINMWQRVGFLSDIFNCFKAHGFSVDLIATSQRNVTVSLDSLLNPFHQSALNSLLENLSKFCQSRCIGPCASISLIGKQTKSIIHELSSVVEIIKEKKIYLISQSESDLNYSFVVDEKEADRICREIHADFFSGNMSHKGFGLAWNKLKEKNKEIEKEKEVTWWEDHREKLCALASESGSSLYVYHKQTVQKQISTLKSIKGLDKIYYAMKANAFPEILKEIHAKGLGFECVSMDEIHYLKSLISDLSYQDILFTPSFAKIDEYEEAFSKGCYVTIDNGNLLEKYPKVFKGQSFLLRIDPETPRGHHKHVKTSGTDSKFGILPRDLERLQERVKELGAQVIGLHAHLGSGVLQADNWKNTALFLAQVAQTFSSIEILNIGGGLGIVEKPGQSPLEIEKLSEMLETFHQGFSSYKLWLEPGRFIVAESGVLLSQVTQLKKKNYKNFIGIDTGMNSLIRPSLYGSYHPIVNLSRFDQESVIHADVVGPICESGDVLGYDRLLPHTEEGDVMLIANTGAYGRVMSSRYNLREPAAEVWFDGL